MMYLLSYTCLLLPAGNAPDWGLADFVAQMWGPDEPNPRQPFDFDGDDDVDLRDFAELQNGWEP